ncbi:MAG: diaminopimelate epimerase [Chlorobi bacterium]|nr:diaminopimelate epimerase [Chlorobiota bacterium]
MQVTFYKYEGAGNDFIMLNNLQQDLTTYLFANNIQKLCDRHFGIGADGLICIEKDTENDFAMRYFNADGNEGTMCGNGGRCIVAFAKFLGLIEKEARFKAIDGIHYAKIDKNEIVELQMSDVSEISIYNDYFVLNTGSPHLVKYVKSLNTLNVYKEGKIIRNSKKYATEGINVNFLEQYGDEVRIRTYERGVENETLACGTGSVASAIVTKLNSENGVHKVKIKTKGGYLFVSFIKQDSFFKNVFLTGPAKFIFKGQILLT